MKFVFLFQIHYKREVICSKDKDEEKKTHYISNIFLLIFQKIQKIFAQCKIYRSAVSNVGA